MSEEIKGMVIEINKTWEAMKEANIKMEAEIKTMGVASGESKEYVTKLEERLDQLEIQAKNKEINNSKEDTKEALEIERKGFETFLRKGMIIPEMSKTMISSNDTTGGYFIMPDYVSGEVIKNITEFSPIRNLARIRQTSSDSVKIRKRTGTITGGQWTAEIGTRQALGAINYGMEELPLHELTGYVDISNKDLADVQFNLEGELNVEFGEQFGLTEGSAFITGNGANKPEGFLANAEILAALTTNGHATELQADALIDLYYALKTYYSNSSQFVLNRNTLKAIRKLKDGNGNYLWTPGFTDGRPSMILERPYTECVDMPDIGANTYPVAYGDFKQGYMIVDRTNMEMMRDPYTQAVTGTTRYYGAKRVGGQVIKAEAIKALKISV